MLVTNRKPQIQGSGKVEWNEAMVATYPIFVCFCVCSILGWGGCAVKPVSMLLSATVEIPGRHRWTVVAGHAEQSVGDHPCEQGPSWRADCAFGKRPRNAYFKGGPGCKLFFEESLFKVCLMLSRKKNSVFSSVHGRTSRRIIAGSSRCVSAIQTGFLVGVFVFTFCFLRRCYFFRSSHFKTFPPSIVSGSICVLCGGLPVEIGQ